MRSDMPPRAADTTLMFAEAAEAGDVMERQQRLNVDVVGRIADSLHAARPPVVLTCARGSSDHAATYARYLIETRLGIVTGSIAPSVGSVYGATPDATGAVCIAISQSGQSPDLLATARQLRARGSRIVALVNAADSPLAESADHVVPLQAGIEASVAATKSYLASLHAATMIVNAAAPDQLPASAIADAPALAREAWELDWSPLADRLRDARGLYVIGRGIGLAAAQEAALKFKETCGLQAEAFSAAEVRHGPMALVGNDFPLLVFRQDDESAAGIDALVRDAVARGGRVLVAGGEPMPGVTVLPVQRAAPVLQPLLQVQTFYRAVNELAIARGMDPDRPPNLRKVTETV